MNFHQVSYLSLLLLITWFHTGCTPNPSNPQINQNNNTPVASTTSGASAKPINQLNMAIIPSIDSNEKEKKIQDFQDYLSQNLGIPVKIQLTKDYDTSIELLTKGQVEIAYFGPLSYIKAKALNPNIEPIAASIEKSTGRPWYTSIIVANKASGINNINDLRGKRFGFNNKSSTSGYLVPLVYFKDLKINPEQYFSEVKYSKSHTENAEALATGKVDAITLEKSAYLKAQEAGKLPISQYPIIWESNPIPNSPIVISSNLPPHLKLSLQKALINAPEGYLSVAGIVSSGYTIVTDANYEPIRELQKKLESKSN
jgi:phosphonate transport system substrate-binding protein